MYFNEKILNTKYNREWKF